MLTVLHAADLHLDSPFRSLSPAQAVRRREEQRELPARLRDLALERRADLCLLAGDLFDSEQVYPETLEALARALGEMPCPVVISPGNHDFWSESSPWAALPWPGNVFIFKSEQLTAATYPSLGVTVYGCAFTSPAKETDPLAGFVAPKRDTLPIGLFHGEVAREGRYAPISPQSLEASGLVYAALGHIHKCSGLQRAGDTLWACPGCPQGRGFDEEGDKGALVVTIGEDGQVEAEFCPLPGPRYLLLTLPLTGAEDPAEALEAALRGCGEDYVRLTLTGECPPPDLPALRRTGAPLCRELELRDGTRPPADLWARAGEDNLTGLFLREMRSRLDAAGEGERDTALLALRFGLAALEGREGMG